MPNIHEQVKRLPVIQADRDAAAACARYFEHGFTADECASGDADHCTLVQILARHRITTLESLTLPAEGEIVERVARAMCEDLQLTCVRVTGECYAVCDERLSMDGWVAEVDGEIDIYSLAHAAVASMPSQGVALPAGYVMVRREVVAFLMGEASLHGLWFGEWTNRGQFWWRDALREALSAAPVADELGVG